MPAERRYASRDFSEGLTPGAGAAGELAPQLWIPIVRADNAALFVVVSVVPAMSPASFLGCNTKERRRFRSYRSRPVTLGELQST